MTTARDICTDALQDAGVTGIGLTPQTAHVNDALRRLNRMVREWNATRWMVYHLVDTDLPMTGARSYTIGIGGQFNVRRPDKIEAARIIQNNPPVPNDVGWPLKLVLSRVNYNNIRMQNLGSFPQYLFYDSDYPLGNLFFWPLPSNIYTGRVTTKAALQNFATLNDVLNMPPEWERCLGLNLAVELQMTHKLPQDPILAKLAMGATNVIKVANFQLPTLELPPELVRNAPYNVFTDNTI